MLICDICGNEIDNKVNFVFIENIVENGIHHSQKNHLCLVCGNDVSKFISDLKK